MTTNSTPDPNKDKDERQVEQKEKKKWNSAKLFENLFNPRSGIDSKLNPAQKVKQLPEEVIQNLDKNLSESEILITAVKEARRVIDCDRVIIYSPPESSQGKVIAEAVTPGFNPLLGNIIKDPYLAPNYLEEYQQGYWQAVNNIEQADIHQKKTKLLAKLQVKAMLVVPIGQQNQLFGLLVAHQCSAARQWQSAEIKYLEQLTTLVKLALERGQLIREKEHLQQQAENEAQWTHFFNEAIPYIYKCFQAKDVLKATVREVRRLLNCDRVLVYSLDRDQYGKIIAESVASGWTKALGQVIDDPCLETRYIEKYQYGHVWVQDNIYAAGISEFDREQLAKLEVKANLVAPILTEDKIFGLLVAHQCSQSRQWKQYEIRWLSQVALQVGFALDNSKLLEDSLNYRQKQNNKTKWMQLLQKLTADLRHSCDRTALLEQTVKEARRILNCDRVVVYSLDRDRYGEVIAESVAVDLTKILGKTIEDPCFAGQYLEKYKQGRVKAINNIYEAGLKDCYVEQLAKLEVKANLVTPILAEGKIFGLLVAHNCHEPHSWSLEEIDFLSQLAHHLGLEFERTRLIAERDCLRQQAEIEREWTEFFTQTVQYIHNSVTEQDALEISVEEIRRVLDCDRVVVYSFDRDRYGEVIAESVALGWTKALGKVIHDPCFEFRYLEKYQHGRVNATDNIYEAGLTDCYVEQLEKLEVKANLVAPILHGGNIFGLLIAHQCSQPRKWKEYEIRWVTQISTQIGFALDNTQLLQQAEQSSLSADYLTHQHSQQKEAFKQQLIAILSSSTNTYEDLTQDALSQSESLLAILHQIAQINDIVKSQADDVNPVQRQKQQQNAKLQQIKESIALTLKGISNLQNSVREATAKMNYLSNSSQKMLEIVHLIQTLAKQIAQQSLNITIAISKTENAEQESIMELVDTLLFDVQKLYKAIAPINPLLSGIDTEACQGKIAMDSALEKAVKGTKLVHAIQQKLQEIIILNSNLNFLLDKFTKASQTQTKISQSTGESVQKVIDLANQISQHSSAITEFFNQLVSLTQEL